MQNDEKNTSISHYVIFARDMDTLYDEGQYRVDDEEERIAVMQEWLNELALLLCDALLPERSDVKELTSVLTEALEIRGGEGVLQDRKLKRERRECSSASLR